jgi:hypothetical protein
MRIWTNGSNSGQWFLTAGLLASLTGCGDSAGESGNETTPLVHCDMRDESSAAPITQACSDITGPLGATVQLGQYGASMDVNVGAGFENVDPLDMAQCPAFVDLFKEDADMSAQLLDVGTQPCTATEPNTGSCLNFQLYTVYRPAIWPEGKIPVLSWGNGTCAQPEGYGTLLRHIASNGFFVVAANSRQVGDGSELVHGIDFAAAANEDPSSPYYGHLDLSKVGVMGHSQGSAGASLAGADPRVSSVILYNAGESTGKPYLAISGDLDIGGYTAQSMATAVAAQPKAAFLYYHNPAGNPADNLRGHLVLMLTPERVVDASTGFWQMMLNGDAAARDLFVGSSCGLCNHEADYAFGQNGL